MNFKERGVAATTLDLNVADDDVPVSPMILLNSSLRKPFITAMTVISVNTPSRMFGDLLGGAQVHGRIQQISRA